MYRRGLMVRNSRLHRQMHLRGCVLCGGRGVRVGPLMGARRSLRRILGVVMAEEHSGEAADAGDPVDLGFIGRSRVRPVGDSWRPEVNYVTECRVTDVETARVAEALGAWDLAGAEARTDVSSGEGMVVIVLRRPAARALAGRIMADVRWRRSRGGDGECSRPGSQRY